MFTKEFRGNRGQTIDYCTIIQSQLSDPTRKFSTRELCILSLALREIEGVVKDTQSPFSVWTLSFFDAISIEPPKDKSPNKYKTSRNITEVRILAKGSLSSLQFANGLSAGISGNEGLNFIVSI